MSANPQRPPSTPEELFAELRRKKAAASPNGEAAPAGPPLASNDPGGEEESDPPAPLPESAVLQRGDDMVGRTLADRFILVPLRPGPGSEDLLFSCNESGAWAWERFDGQRSLADLAEEMSREFDIDAEQALADLRSFAGNLLAVGAAVERRPEE